LSTDLRTELPEAVEELERLVAASQAEQEAIHRFRQHYDQLPKDTPLAPRSLHRLRDGSAAYLDLQDRLKEDVKRYEPLAEMDDEQLAELEIDPRQQRTAVTVSLAAALTVYDNYLSMRSILEDDRLRRLVNDPDVGYGIEENELRRFVEDLYSADNRARVRKLLAWYEADDAAPDPDTDDERYLRSAIESSVSYRYAREKSLWSIEPRACRRSTRLPGFDKEPVGRVGGNHNRAQRPLGDVQIRMAPGTGGGCRIFSG